MQSLPKFYSKHKFVWFCYLVVFISTLLFCKQLPILPGFCCAKITLFNAVHCDGKISREDLIVIKVLRVEKVGADAAF